MTYCITSEALMHPFNEDAFGTTVFNAVKRAYLNVFGDINMAGIEKNIMEGQLLYSLLHIRYTAIFKLPYDVYFKIFGCWQASLHPQQKEAFQKLSNTILT